MPNIREHAADIGLSRSTLALVRRRGRQGCFMCRWILASTEEDGTLRDFPGGTSDDDSVLFPVDAQRRHILAELGQLEARAIP